MQATIDKLIDDFLASCDPGRAWHIPRSPLTDALKNASRQEHVLVLHEVMRRLRFKETENYDEFFLCSLFSQIARRKLSLAEEDLLDLLSGFVNAGHLFLSPATLLGRIEDYSKEHDLSRALRQSLRRLQAKRRGVFTSSPMHKRTLDRIKRILGDGDVSFTLDTAEAWARQTNEYLTTLSAEQAAKWRVLLEHASTATASKPSRKWLKAANQLIDPIGEETFTAAVGPWFQAVGQPARRPVLSAVPVESTLLGDRSSDLLRGLVWCLADRPSDVHAKMLGDLADRCFARLPDIGARCPKLGNACLYTLGQMADPQAVAQLSRLKTKVRKPSMRQAVEKALAAASEKAGVSPDELEEMATPTFGFGADGCLRVTLGEHTAELTIDGSNATQLSWIGQHGKRTKSVPKAVKENHAEELKSLRATAKEVKKTLPVIRRRLDRLRLMERTWPYPLWCKRYRDHPLVGPLALRLIWIFEQEGTTTVAGWHDGTFQRSDGTPFEPAKDATVRAWHPIDANVEEIRAWRQWLETHQITQPFKQAHREIYILTDAERESGSYSNRFAAHILKQHQLNALAEQRGWKTGLFGMFESDNTPTLQLPHWGMSAEYWLSDMPGQADAYTPMGIALYVATDQVRFYRDGAQMALEDVPPIVFSEVMRDVDLFVGVASVGNDPYWVDDRGEGGRAYWDVYSWGDLSQTAITRREVLARLLPQLKIADRCELEDRFLRVRGDLRTYRIHLGSGNIMMEPNDQYLCIVPSHGTSRGGTVYLPFEGDGTMAIILSKAFMLADDRSIKDETIISQIQRR